MSVVRTELSSLLPEVQSGYLTVTELFQKGINFISYHTCTFSVCNDLKKLSLPPQHTCTHTSAHTQHSDGWHVFAKNP